ncbi:MAG TPA: BtpA/SgcQ family protein [Longimicrobiales bacterium]|nr:BtpA/SgcQ family protein [Longimicrobiales bacterium]
MSQMIRPQGLSHLWGNRKALIGMVHLLPLPGAPRWGGSMAKVLDRAMADADALASGGVDGILVENFLDAPFFAEGVPPETVAAMAAVVSSVVAASPVPVGVNVLRNDARAALGIAVATGAAFIRINVHTGVMWTDQGMIEGRAADTLRHRASLDADVAILADVLVKHATPPPGLTLERSASDAWTRGLADALVVTGAGTGQPTDLEGVSGVRRGAPHAPILVGSGVTPQNIAAVLTAADGAIVGTSLTKGGLAGSGVDLARVRALVAERPD